MPRKKKRFSHVQRRSNARRRKLGYVPLFENPFPKSDVRSIDMHHVNGLIVVPLPHRTHKMMADHENHCKHWIEKLFLIDIDSLLSSDLPTAEADNASSTESERDALRGYETVIFDER
ncbi:MAG TPA: hypothetical protein VMT57_06675 [Candidatus Thermoplasmatota archaeon]|nr:hypothetical protein [Candidatus Thermoplasmatota archaeon]